MKIFCMFTVNLLRNFLVHVPLIKKITEFQDADLITTFPRAYSFIYRLSEQV